MRFWPSKKQPIEKIWIASVEGHYPVGLFCREVYFNLYQDEQGNRSYDEYAGAELTRIPRNANFKAKADVEAWIHSKGDLTLCTYNPFKEAEKSE